MSCLIRARPKKDVQYEDSNIEMILDIEDIAWIQCLNIELAAATSSSEASLPSETTDESMMNEQQAFNTAHGSQTKVATPWRTNCGARWTLCLCLVALRCSGSRRSVSGILQEVILVPKESQFLEDIRKLLMEGCGEVPRLEAQAMVVASPLQEKRLH